MRIILATAALGMAVSGCASMGQPDRPMSYRQELAQLQTTCENRGGILTPLNVGAASSSPATDYACEIRGGASHRIN